MREVSKNAILHVAKITEGLTGRKVHTRLRISLLRFGPLNFEVFVIGKGCGILRGRVRRRGMFFCRLVLARGLVTLRSGRCATCCWNQGGEEQCTQDPDPTGTNASAFFVLLTAGRRVSAGCDRLTK